MNEPYIFDFWHVIRYQLKKHKYINEKKNDEFAVSQKAFHSQKVSFRVSTLIPITKANPQNILISDWFAKINLANDISYCWFAKINPRVIYWKLPNTRKV